MRKYFFRALILLAILWAASCFYLLPSTEQSLTTVARDKLQEAKHRGYFKQVKVDFSGQEATLRGIVALPTEKTLAGEIVANEVRLENQRGSSYNPVTAVHNDITVDPAGSGRRPSWLIASLQPGGYRIDGVLPTPGQVTQLMEKFIPKAPTGKPDSQVVSMDASLPPADWEATLEKLPDFKSQLEGKQDKARGLIATTACDGAWTVLPPTASDEEIAASLKQSKVAPTELTRAVASLRAWQNGPSQAELDRLAAEKAKAEADAKAQAEAMAKQRQEAEAAARKAAEIPAYFGLAVAGKSAQLFGAVPNEETRNLALTTAQSTYPTAQIDAANLRLEAARTLPTPPSLKLAAAPTGKPNFISMASFDGTAKLYDADAFDSEIAKDFPALKFKEGDLSGALAAYRTGLAGSGAIAKDDPYLGLATDGKSLIITGEVADADTKTKLLAKLTATQPALPLVDKLKISPLVNPSPDLAATLDSVPTFVPGTNGVAVARPGQKWRFAVVHSIYFKTGSNRSKDQERALSQMQRIREILPTATFEIVGHTDNVGQADANKKLSLQRAQSFVAVATAAGFDASLLSARGAGPEEPIGPNDSDAGKALNRRVDVMLK